MKQVEELKNEDNLPIATEIIKIYKRSNRRLFIIVTILLTIIFLETTYMIILLDSLNSSVGLISEEANHQCE